ncbi:hypothetical protein PCAR4_1000030 [Paraburkholderia caribensis]|nr:hypothetical protein PCAR4_1000030 [Paraburkholderia caribensis]
MARGSRSAIMVRRMADCRACAASVDAGLRHFRIADDQPHPYSQALIQCPDCQARSARSIAVVNGAIERLQLPVTLGLYQLLTHILTRLRDVTGALRRAAPIDAALTRVRWRGRLRLRLVHRLIGRHLLRVCARHGCYARRYHETEKKLLHFKAP